MPSPKPLVPAAKSWWKKPVPTWIRRGLGAAWLLCGVYLLVGGQIGEVCRQELADNSTAVMVCAPVAVTDPRVLAWLLVVVLLFMPDLSEIEIGGILKLHRAVDEARVETQALRGEIRAQAAAQARAASASGASATVHVHPLLKSLDDWDAANEPDAPGTLSPTAERGAYAERAFTAGLDGLIGQFFSRWQDNVCLVGWILGRDGGFELSFLMPESAPADPINAMWDQLDVLSASDGATFLTGDPSAHGVAAYAFSDPGLAGQRHLLGALGALVIPDNVALPTPWAVVNPSDAFAEGFDVEEISELTGATSSAAGVYGLMLTQLLGERPTMWGLAAAEGGEEHGS